MKWMTDGVLFYGGIIIAGSSFVMSMIYLIVSHIRKIHIDIQLDEEYGKNKLLIRK